MAYADDPRLLVKIARLYYEEGATQAQIADLMGISRPLVSKSLQRARDEEIVEITIHDEKTNSHTGIERALEKRYGLKEAIVVSSTTPERIKRRLGVAASDYFLRVVKPEWKIAVSWGTTLAEFAEALPHVHKPDLTLVSIVGGAGQERVSFHSNLIAGQFAEKLDANYMLLHAPVWCDTPEAKEVFLEQSSIRQVMEVAKQADMALVGIGGPPQESTMVQYYLDEKEQAALRAAGAIGDVCSIFIDSHGRPIAHHWNQCVMTMNLDDLRGVPLVMALASGLEKVDGIRAALRAGLLHVLVTDESTANAVLDEGGER